MENIMDNIYHEEHLKGNSSNNNKFDNKLVISIELIKQLEVVSRCQELQLVRKLDNFMDNLGKK
tara:strand:- start:28 stop:219 length:192 start_codon:yes stop_codon:yes gene_type:complete